MVQLVRLCLLKRRVPARRLIQAGSGGRHHLGSLAWLSLLTQNKRDENTSITEGSPGHTRILIEG